MIFIQQNAYFYFDDSGVLHKNEASGIFLYAGFVFLSREDISAAKRKYVKAHKPIKEALGTTEELKASMLSKKHKRTLYNAVREYETVSAVVEIAKVYDRILSNKKAICRYKDYILKRVVKAKLQSLIDRGSLCKDNDISIYIYIDEQRTASNGYYSLDESITEELAHGIINYDYGGIIHKRVFTGNVTVHVEYCDSSKHYLIQACDILANRLLSSYRDKKENLREISGHICLTFPKI